jgi:FKBP-type peptidyl-prolyl cis-trans isomerase FklB
MRHGPIFFVLSIACFLFVLVSVAATDEAGTAYLEERSKDPAVVTLPSGLRYKVLEKGQGAFHPKVNSPCLCHYAGTLIDGTEFDSSYSRGSPTTFAPNQVIKG